MTMSIPVARPENHCRRKGCECLHDGCVHGWIDFTDQNGNFIPDCDHRNLRRAGGIGRASLARRGRTGWPGYVTRTGHGRGASTEVCPGDRNCLP